MEDETIVTPSGDSTIANVLEVIFEDNLFISTEGVAEQLAGYDSANIAIVEASEEMVSPYGIGEQSGLFSLSSEILSVPESDYEIAIAFDAHTDMIAVQANNLDVKTSVLHALKDNKQDDVVDTLIAAQADIVAIANGATYGPSNTTTSTTSDNFKPVEEYNTGMDSGVSSLSVLVVGSVIVGVVFLASALITRGSAEADSQATTPEPLYRNPPPSPYEVKPGSSQATLDPVEPKVDAKLYKYGIVQTDVTGRRIYREIVTHEKPDLITSIVTLEECLGYLHELETSHRALGSRSLSSEIKSYAELLEELTRQLNVSDEVSHEILKEDLIKMNKDVMRALDEDYYMKIARGGSTFDKESKRLKEVEKALGKLEIFVKKIIVELNKKKDDTLRMGLADILNRDDDLYKEMTNFEKKYGESLGG